MKEFQEIDRLVNMTGDTPEGNAELRRQLKSRSELLKACVQRPSYGGEEGAAAQHARRFYRQDHFMDQVGAERAYFRVLAGFLQRGQRIAELSRKLGKARERANCLRRINLDLHRQLAQRQA